MQSALSLARRGLGRTWPNPSVGCVVVKNGRVLSRARTADGGRPHAETQALSGVEAQGADIYVTLEPCSHHGKTPPCVEALIAAKPSRVIIAMEDPDPRVSGQGVKALQEAGIEVTLGVCEDQDKELLKGYILNRTENRPLVTLKIASSLDGKVATPSGQSQWITGETARRFGHKERCTHDAIAIGRGTAEADNPSLTARYGYSPDPYRILFDTNMRLPAMHNKVNLVICSDKTEEKKDVETLKISIDSNGLVSISKALNKLSEKGITSLLVEGGPTLISSFIKSGLYDRILWFRAPKIIGGDGLASIAGLGLDRLKECDHLKTVETRSLGVDTLDILEKVA